nr:NAD-dependent epimerase/dehydratase family protein [Companilactobacillus crustorum]
MMKKVLVTGGSGFLGLHILFQLLQKNYQVTTTIRSEKSKKRVLDTLMANGSTNLNRLSFVKADLSADDNWSEAMSGQDYVLSVASPVFFGKIKNESEAIKPATEGIMRILKFAQAAQVKKVVMTSNFGAVGFSKKAGPGVVTTENDWTDVNMPGLSVYEKSKLIAERTAWKYIRRPDVDLEFTTVNPVAIYGPSLNDHVSGSFGLLENILSKKAIVDLPLNVIDVRDVADIHIRAMENPQANGHRFIATDDGQITLRQIADLIRKNRPELADLLSTKVISQRLIKIMAIFSKRAREGQVMLTMNRNVSNESARDILGWKPLTNNEETILMAVDAMEKNKLIEP